MLFQDYLGKKSSKFFPAEPFLRVLQIKCLSKCPYFNSISTRREGGGFRTPPPSPNSFRLFYINQKLAKLVSRDFVTFPKIYLAIFIQNNENVRIIEPPRGQRSAAYIFKKLKALDISLVMYYWKVFSSLITKKGIRNSNYLI